LNSIGVDFAKFGRNSIEWIFVKFWSRPTPSHSTNFG